MDIKSIKQSFAVTTAQPLYELVKLIGDKKEVCRLERYEDDDVQYLSKANQFFLLIRFLDRLETIKFDHDTFVEI